MINLLWTILFSLVAGFLYMCGGLSKQGKWFDFILKTKTRDFGVPLCMLALLTVTGWFHWSLILCFGALFGSLTTYHKYMGYLFNRPDKSTVYWESWLMTGFCYGLSMLPYAIATGSYLGFGLRTLLVAAFVCLWSEVIGKSWLEESGRGFVIIATLPLLFI